MITQILLIIFLFFVLLGIGATIWDKLPEKYEMVEENGETFYVEKTPIEYNGKKKKHPRDIGTIIICIVALIFLIGSISGSVIINTTQHNKIVGNDKCVVTEAYIDKGGLDEFDVVSIYYNETNDEYYYLKEHLFNPFKMYEKQVLTKEFVDIQLKEQEYFKEMFG